MNSPTISDVERDKVPLVDLIEDPYLKQRVARVCQLRDDAINAFAALSAQKSERDSVIEQCAKVAEEYRGPPPLRHAGTCRGIASAIRNLKIEVDDAG